MLCKTKKTLLGGAALMVALSPLVAQKDAQAAQTTVNVDARINAQIQLNVTTHMNFGTLTHGGVAGTAALDFADTVTGGGGFQPAGGTTSSAQVNITSEPSTAIRIDTTAATFTLDHAGAPTVADILQVNNFDFQYNATATALSGAALTVSAPTGGTANLLIGADLVAGAAQATGAYSGTFTLEVVYN